MAGLLSTIIRKQFSTTSKYFSAHGSHADHASAMKMWKNLSYFVALPAVGLCMVNTYITHSEEDHSPPEFVPYEHMRIRTRKFPWGDGQRTLFHNPHFNALPTGYEVDPSHH